jgi:hypothetical protein
MKTLDEIYQDSLKKIEEAGAINEITSEILRITEALKIPN